MLTEMIGQTDIARGIAYYDISWYLAGAIGSKVGGSLSRPAEQFPGLFGSSEFLKKYPYFLPCAICSMSLFASWLLGTIFLKETLQKPLPLFGFKTQESEPVDDCDTTEEDESTERPSPLRAIFVPRVIIFAINLAALSLLEKFYWATEALFLSTPIRVGGLGLSPGAIGTFQSYSTLFIGISQLFIFPFMHDRWGSKNIFILGVFATLPRFIMWPVMNGIARSDGHPGLVYFALGSQVCCSTLAEFAYLSIWVMIAKLPGNRDSLGSILGFCQTVTCVVRTVAPTVSNTLFSLSTDRNYLGGYLVYFFFVFCSIMALCAASTLSRY